MEIDGEWVQKLIIIGILSAVRDRCISYSD